MVDIIFYRGVFFQIFKQDNYNMGTGQCYIYSNGRWHDCIGDEYNSTPFHKCCMLEKEYDTIYDCHE